MKVSQGIHCWLEYHNLHSKKHHQNPPVDPFQNHHPIWRKRPEFPNPWGFSLFCHPGKTKL